MLKVTRETRGPALVLRLAGTIDENDSLETLFGAIAPGSGLILNCRAITTLNSMGVRNWIAVFDKFRKRGHKLQFEEIAVNLVEEVNMVKNFIETAEIESMLIPYHCASCTMNMTGTLRPDDVRRLGFQIPDVICPQCGQKATFDDDVDGYFYFLRRK